MPRALIVLNETQINDWLTWSAPPWETWGFGGGVWLNDILSRLGLLGLAVLAYTLRVERAGSETIHMPST
jgi:hypothetical protein